jgi:ubiquinone/menaquinone biosynthesis C-methylase UbiE/uncharacterized protein YbaR (Trm112 family)
MAAPTKKYDLNILLCPRCNPAPAKSGTTLEEAGGLLSQKRLVCRACKEEYPVVDGIPQLLKDPTLFTQLEAIDYDDHHNIDDVRREKVARDWKKVFDRHQPVMGDVLEIGSGTGQLTWGLANRFPFKSVHACDISTKFLQQAAGVVGNSPVPVSYYACDANYLPFQENSFDLVVGHSVLHHFVDYKKIIHHLGKLLRPGGQAIFYEPVLQGKILVAFMADLMRRIEKNTNWGVLDEKDDARINHMTRHIMKAQWIGDDRERLSKIEDKYVFDINEMRALAYEAGFKGMEHSNLDLPEKGYKHYLDQHLLMEGIPAAKIQKFAFVPAALMQTMGVMIPGDIATPMGYFSFRK